MKLPIQTPKISVRWLWQLGAALSLLAAAAFTTGCQAEQMEDEEPVEAGTIEPAEEGEEEIGPIDHIQLELAFLEPGENVGMEVAGRAPVTEVVSDRGFWLGRGEDRIFAVVREDVPRQEMIDINAGQLLDIRGTLLDEDSVDEAVEGTLEGETRATIEGQEHFISVHHRDIAILSRPQAGQADQKMLEVAGEEYGSFADYDVDENNLVTNEELTRGLEEQGLFDEWDEDDDDLLDEDEFTTHIYAVADTDQDDLVDEDEFTTFANTFEPLEDEVDDFDDWDINDDDLIDEDEFAEGLDDEEVFDDWDFDDDDYVSYEDYGEGWFSIWDEDQDGFLGLEDFGLEDEEPLTLK